MSSYVTEWNSLETIGKRGSAFKQPRDYFTTVGRTALRYASITGLCLSIISLIMVVL